VFAGGGCRAATSSWRLAPCRRLSAAETIDCGGRVLMPGFRTRTRTPMTLLRGPPTI
jgi:hypothetical protein